MPDDASVITLHKISLGIQEDFSSDVITALLSKDFIEEVNGHYKLKGFATDFVKSPEFEDKARELAGVNEAISDNALIGLHAFKHTGANAGKDRLKELEKNGFIKKGKITPEGDKYLKSREAVKRMLAMAK